MDITSRLSQSVIEVASPRRLAVLSKEQIMSRGINNIAIPVKDLSAAKALYGGLLGVEPYADQPYYVGFRVGDLEVGLDPNGHSHGATAYYRVDDVHAGLRSVLDAGGQQVQEVKDVGGGRLTAVARDADGNIIGLIQAS
jgi:predicted enzyme related to lactoylglutathione lyase